jgi:hypothetical protein
MAYIGSTPTSGDFVLLDSITTSATASYTMQRNSVNFEPQSANHMILSLNGTIQAPISSFTVSGSTLTFASALTSSDVIDFILVLGNVNDVGTATTVVDSSITNNKLDLISTSSTPGLTVKGDGSSENGTIQLNCSQNSHGVKLSSPAHSAGQSYELILPTGNVTADKFLKVASVSGSGTTGIGQLSFADAGGTLVKVHTITASDDSTVTFNSTYLTSTYKRYTLEIFDLQPASDNQPFMMEFSTDNGSSYLTGSVDRLNIGTSTDEGNDAIKSRNTSGNNQLQIAGGTNHGTGTGEVAALSMQLVNFSDTAHYKLVYYTGAKVNSDNKGSMEFGAGAVRTTSAVNNIKFTFSSGNISAGTFILYGIT